jgi:hypothetical protein
MKTTAVSAADHATKNGARLRSLAAKAKSSYAVEIYGPKPTGQCIGRVLCQIGAEVEVIGWTPEGSARAVTSNAALIVERHEGGCTVQAIDPEAIRAADREESQARAKARKERLAREAPMTKEEADEAERERQEHMAEFLAAQKVRHAEEYRAIMAEENARNGRGHGTTVRA